MRTYSKSTLELVLIVFSLAFLCAPKVWADQPDGPDSTAPIKPQQAEEFSWHAIKLRYVIPHIMAFWIDPDHNANPQILGAEKTRLTKNREVSSTSDDLHAIAPKRKTILELPEGVNSVVSVDALNTLLVYSTSPGFNKISVIVAYLDRPIRTVNLTIYEVEADEKTAIAQSWATDEKPKTIALTDKGFRELLEKLKAQGEIKIVRQTRISTLSNSTAFLRTTQAVPVTIFVQSGGKILWDNNSIPMGRDSRAVFHYSDGENFSVTPTVNNDGSFTLFMQLSNSPSLITTPMNRNETPEIILTSHTDFTGVINMRAEQVVSLVTPVVKPSVLNPAGEPNIHRYFISARIGQSNS